VVWNSAPREVFESFSITDVYGMAPKILSRRGAVDRG
jgi:hypothetical protein